MKKVFAGAVLSCLSLVAGAQSYIGGTVGAPSFKIDCSGATLCDKGKDAALKVYFGAKFEDKHVIRLGSSLTIDAVEMGLMSFGRAKVVAEREFPVADEDTGAISNVVKTSENLIRARAIAAAIVGRWQIAQPAAVLLRVGGAYVTASADESINGVSNGSAVESKLKPYVGLGLEYDLAGVLKLTAGWDVTQYETGTFKGTLSMWGLGVQKDF